MKKRLSAVLIFLSSLMILTGCGSGSGEDGAPDGMKTASPREVDYVLYVPEDWKVDTAEGSILTAAHVEDGDNSNITMMTYTNDGDLTSISEYWENYQKNLPGIFDSDSEGNSTYKLTTDGEEAYLDGEVCNIYRYEGLIAGIPLRYMQVITYHNGDFYLFTYTATTENDRYGRNEEDVAKMLNEFKFKS